MTYSHLLWITLDRSCRSGSRNTLLVGVSSLSAWTPWIIQGRLSIMQIVPNRDNIKNYGRIKLEWAEIHHFLLPVMFCRGLRHRWRRTQDIIYAEAGTFNSSIISCDRLWIEDDAVRFTKSEKGYVWPPADENNDSRIYSGEMTHISNTGWSWVRLIIG